MLKDLLASRALQTAIGPALLYILEVLVGTPSALNLRNLLWHGFLSLASDDVDAVMAPYCTLIFFVFAAIARVQNDADNESRNNLDTEIENEQAVVTTGAMRRPDHVMVAHLDSPLVSIAQGPVAALWAENFFIVPGRKRDFRQAVALLRDSRADLASVVLLPSLEHCLRRLYVYCNDLPVALACAEHERLFTTLDDVLAPKLADGTPNLLWAPAPVGLGVELGRAFWDVLQARPGCRLRDRIAHGEVCTMPHALVEWLLVLADRAAACCRGPPPSHAIFALGSTQDIARADRASSTSLFHASEFSYVCTFTPGAIVCRLHISLQQTLGALSLRCSTITTTSTFNATMTTATARTIMATAIKKPDEVLAALNYLVVDLHDKFALPTCLAPLKNTVSETAGGVIDCDDVVVTVAAALAVADAEELRSLCNDGFQNPEGSTILGMQSLDLVGLGRIYASCTETVEAFLRSW
jgi:hypothetical protein